MGLKSALTIEDLKRRARRRVPKLFFDYVDSGALNEQTYRANEADFQKVLLRQRVARDLSNRSLKTMMAGRDVAMPVALAPVGMCGMQHADGEILAARAAKAFGVPFTLSTMSICSMEDVARATNHPFWFQLYMMRDRDFAKSLVDRAKAAGADALVLTVDLQLMAKRHKDHRNELQAPPKLTPKHIYHVMTRPIWAMKMAGTRRHTFGNIVGHAKGVDSIGSIHAWTNKQFDPELSWKDVSWIKKHWGGRLIVKGVLDVEDARAAVDAGADVINVSNHGGRQLDGTVSSIRAFPEIADAVGKQVELHMDGGVRTGIDVMRARALGAKGVWVARPYLYGLGAAGEAGVSRALEILRDELDVTMGLCGERDIEAVGPHNIFSRGF